MTDEQALTDEFESECGSVEKAQRLFQIWKDSHANGTALDILHQRPWAKSREQVFEARAKAEGFTKRQIGAFYACQ